jgi:hypothetical protein
MAALQGIAPTPRLFGATNAALSVELNTLGEGAFAPATYARERLVARAGAFRAPVALRWPATGRLAHRFAEDYFDRIHLTPIALSLGKVVSELTREIAVWNAWRATSQTLTALRLMGDAGSTLTAPGSLPLPLRPMQERVLTLTVGLDGPPVIDAAAVLSFADGSTWSIRIDGLRLNAWSLPPDWTEPVIETLAWLTDVQVALAGTVTRWTRCCVVQRCQKARPRSRSRAQDSTLRPAVSPCSGATWPLTNWWKSPTSQANACGCARRRAARGLPARV